MTPNENRHKAIQNKREEFRSFVFLDFDKINHDTIHSHVVRAMIILCMRENKELEKVLLNTAYNFKIIGTDNKDYKFDPDFYVINYNILTKIVNDLQRANVAALLDAFINATDRTGISFQILVNTLIKHEMLVNVYPSYLASDSFKDLFEL